MPEAPRFPPMPGSTGFIHLSDKQPAYWMQDILPRRHREEKAHG